MITAEIHMPGESNSPTPAAARKRAFDVMAEAEARRIEFAEEEARDE